MKYVKIFLDSIESLEILSDEERGRLFLAILRYAKSGEVPDLPGNERYLWQMFKRQADRAFEKYQEKVAATPRRKKQTPSYDLEEIRRFIEDNAVGDGSRMPA